MTGKTTACLILLISGFLLQPAVGEAQEPPSSFGIGVIAGEPTGLTARIMKGGNNFQVHAAWSFADESALHLSGDYLKSGNVNTEPMIPFYFGLGVRAKFADKSRFGIRIPLGVNYFLKENPIEFFGEIVPILDLAPSTELTVNGGVGVRLYLKSGWD
jgi:hypothetical protein